ncbi:hypothetical protein KDH_68300 [Dictyobacter sp. S3.2.2.5]|uniref:Protein kinase domain-containing protein n=1 Tax=Dictyobacter halimunensis TaxID=3026934 RepID=A0ABQ6G0I0_9CHLR|nr:hypothetical protein KDH_68300 [Dictyobacter sp. S3.2.2.5]
MQLQIHIGQKIGDYRIVDEIARGVYAYVYKAVHSFLSQRPVALKILHTTFVDPGAEQDILHQEAQILEQLRHPHILSMIDFGTHEGAPYIVKEYAPGGSLRDHLRHPLPLSQALALLDQVGEGLQFAHTHSVVHCDLKPENILFNADDHALISDFDIARVLKSVKTSGHGIGGTPSYMAPEQFQGKVSYASDQYALACMAYEMLTGQRPFAGNDVATLMQKHLHEEPVPPSQLTRGLPHSVDQAILRGLSKKPADRFKDVAAFIKALDTHHQHSSEVTTADWPVPAVAPRRGKRLILRAPGTPRSARKTPVDDSVFYEETVPMNAEATLADLAPATAPRKRRATSKTSTTKKVTPRTKTTKAVEKSATTKKAPARAKTEKAESKSTAKKAPVHAKTEKAESKTPIKKAPARSKAEKPATKKAPVHAKGEKAESKTSAKKAPTRAKTSTKNTPPRRFGPCGRFLLPAWICISHAFSCVERKSAARAEPTIFVSDAVTLKLMGRKARTCVSAFLWMRRYGNEIFSLPTQR